MLFEDNDAPGRTLAEHVSVQIHPVADSVRRIAFLNEREKSDITNWVKAHDPEQLIADLERMVETASPWKPLVQQDRAAADDSWASEGMDTFLASDDVDIPYLVPDVLARSCLMQIFAPRGIGKSVLAAYWAASLVSSGKRVLMLDRDNPRYMVSGRLHSLGADDLAEQRPNLRAISRERCPKLMEHAKWASFPYSDFDLVVVDAWDSMAEGVGEQDSSKPARALAPLLDVCRRENGPAVLLLGNTIKSAQHSRGPASSKTGRTSCTRCGTPRDSDFVALRPDVSKTPVPRSGQFPPLRRDQANRADLALSAVDQRRRSTAESGSADAMGICLVLPPSRSRRERQVNARKLSELAPRRTAANGLPRREWVADSAGVDPVLTILQQVKTRPPQIGRLGQSVCRTMPMQESRFAFQIEPLKNHTICLDKRRNPYQLMVPAGEWRTIRTSIVRIKCGEPCSHDH